MSKKIFLLVLIFTHLILRGNTELKIVENGFLNDEHYPQSVHAACVCEVQKGTYLAAFFGGSYEKCPDTSIWVCKKIGNGKWSKPKELLKGFVDGTNLRRPVWNPFFATLANGETALFYKVGDSPRTWRGFFCKTADGGKNWSRAYALPEGFVGSTKCKPLNLKNGELLFASSVETNSRGGWYVRFERADGNLKNWSASEPKKGSKNFFLGSCGIDAIQPSLIELKDGTIIALCRTQNEFLALTKSENSGKTWSDLSLTKIPNVNSAIDTMLLDDGSILIVGNFDSEKKRKKLSIIKTADFENWQELLVLEDSPRKSYSYPYLIKTSDSSLLILYTYDRKHIKYVKLNLK